MTREVNINWKPSNKQLKAFHILEDKETNELLYGGGAGGGKSYLGCAWLILNCLRYQGSRWLMGRAVLKDLKDSTLLTFFEICAKWGLVKDIDFKYNSMEGVITFIHTGSQIYLKDLFQYPSDPEFAGLGSREYTGIFIDEGNQIGTKAFNICKSRIRYKLDEFGLIPKILVASNPAKNFLYYDFYKPYRKDTLKPYRKFLPALVQDNPFITKYYIENLRKLDRVSKERLLYGNWEYDDDDSALFEYDKIVKMFDISFGDKELYLTCDVARFGKDYTVLMLWSGLFVKKIWVYKKQSLDKTKDKIDEIRFEKHIDIRNIIIDEDGMGGGIIDQFRKENKMVQGFINNSRPIERKVIQSVYTKTPLHNYANLKAQCYFLLARYVNNEKIGIYKAINETSKSLLIEDLEQIKQKDIDKDGKLTIVSKEMIREAMGRSTDFSDAMMMRMYYELKTPLRHYAVGGRAF